MLAMSSQLVAILIPCVWLALMAIVLGACQVAALADAADS
jgi:hypothetical protein